jgi:hypothetical protein
MWLGRMLGGRGVERMGVMLVSWSCLLGVQAASVDTPEPKDQDRILHGKPLSDQVSRYVVREDAWGRGDGEDGDGAGVLVLPPGGPACLC